MDGSALETANSLWGDAIGPDHVVTRPTSCARFERATFDVRRAVSSVLRPADTAQVAECLRIATETGVPVYPVSGGRNWGYGSAVPSGDQQVVLDLCRLNRIVKVDPELTYAEVEAGVTFEQLAGFLLREHPDVMVPVPGTSPDASIVGNAVERGLALGPMHDRFGNVANMQVALPTGEVIQTGFGRYPAASAAPLHRWGVGPGLDGLFSQSSFGVVTRMSTWLMPKPKNLALINFSVSDPSRLGPLVDRLRQCRREQVDVRLQNGVRYTASQDSSPRGALRRLVDRGLLARNPSWVGVAAVYAQSADEERYLVAEFKQRIGTVVDRVVSWGTATQRRLAKATPLLRPLGIDVGPISRIARSSLWVGWPSVDAIKPVYAATKKTPTSSERPDLDEDKVGVIWLCPAVPFRSAEIVETTSIIERSFARHGFQPSINLRFVSPRVVDVVLALNYDRDEPGADERAMHCHDDVLQILIQSGYYPYRLGLQTMNKLPRPIDQSSAVMRRLKRCFDPSGILAPGRHDAFLNE